VEDASLAIADTGPVIALFAIDLLSVLCARFREVRVPLSVWNELNALPGAPEPRALGALPCVRLVPDVDDVPADVERLGAGERQAIALAIAMQGTVVLIDDGAARRVARSRGLPHVGTVGLVALAKATGVCASARAPFERLLASDFRIDRAIVNAVLADLGEDPLH
jgi:hypothetical protein